MPSSETRQPTVVRFWGGGRVTGCRLREMSVAAFGVHADASHVRLSGDAATATSSTRSRELACRRE
eukprot:scaffold84928_cov15-Phaeocystis_antarctica.AAC.1